MGYHFFYYILRLIFYTLNNPAVLNLFSNKKVNVAKQLRLALGSNSAFSKFKYMLIGQQVKIKKFLLVRVYLNYISHFT